MASEVKICIWMTKAAVSHITNKTIEQGKADKYIAYINLIGTHYCEK